MKQILRALLIIGFLVFTAKCKFLFVVTVVPSHTMTLADTQQLCNYGFTGENCENAICNPADFTEFQIQCNKIGGICNGTVYPDIVCECIDGYTGSSCSDYFTCGSLIVTDSNVCSGRGECIAQNNCTCSDGYSGTNCEVNPVSCFGVPDDSVSVCDGHGACVSDNLCVCNLNYTGKNGALSTMVYLHNNINRY
jgi:hypothetical protein